MPHRTPSFVIVGLVIIVFLLASFYMSCSSKSTELRQILEDFEDRVRTLTLKNSDNERKIETINTRKRELEEEKSDNQKQLEKKDSEINNLNTKLNEKNVEIQSLKSDKQVLDEQLKDFKNTNEILASKNAIIEKLQQDFNEQKKSHEEHLTQLKQDIDNYKSRLNTSLDNQEKSFLIPVQRFPPLLGPDESIQNSSSLFQKPLAKLKNIRNEIKEKVSDIFARRNNSVLNDNAHKFGPGEAALMSSENGKADQVQNDSNFHRRIQRSLNNSEIDTENAQIPVNAISVLLLNETNIVNNQSQLSADRKNYRKRNRQIRNALN